MKKLFLFAAGLILINSCYYDNIEDLYTQSTATCDTVNISYNNHIKAIMNNYCISCHKTSYKGGGINLDNFNDVKSCAQSGKLLSSIVWDGNAKRMPEGSSSKINSCYIKQLNIWISNNYPQ
jgi:hypothetical protein